MLVWSLAVLRLLMGEEVDAVAGFNTLEMILEIYECQKAGQPVKLPLQDFASIDMVGEF